MFDDADKMSSFGGFDDSFINRGSNTSNPFMRDHMPSFSFDSGNIFDRIFPLSPVERFNNTPLRKMSNGDLNGAPGVVRNIPIKVEGTRNVVQPRAQPSGGTVGYSSATMRPSRQASAPPPSFDSCRLPKR
ncbi:unnamed protein product [Anisakis simplex]|uniref:Ovule protein n=1 Tax=Anisakis simplex TaxID=6269 RepID=A0A0M3KDR7_ANISI|nr:unnamed protein product [Anisakis simplex]